jgi:hypothetical protein
LRFESSCNVQEYDFKKHISNHKINNFSFQELDPLKAEVAKITPTANNGYTVLVPINYKYLVIIL